MRALHLNQFRRPSKHDFSSDRAKERAKRIPIYAERARDGRPLFEKRISVTVRKLHRLAKKAV